MRMAVRVGLALALAGTSGWARAQEPDATHEAQAEVEQERTQRESERAEREAEREEREQERANAMDERYEHATELVDEGHWDQAIQMFDQIVREKGRRADASLYWKAYALQKLGRDADALETLNQLRSAHPKSSWVKQAKVLELEIRQGGGSAPRPEELADEDLKLMALNGLMNSDPQKALPLLRRFLESSQSPKLRDRALFVLAQSGSPEAREILVGVARGESHPDMQRKAIQYLSLFGGAESRQALADIYQASSDPSVKKAVLQAFMIGGEKPACWRPPRASPTSRCGASPSSSSASWVPRTSCGRCTVPRPRRRRRRRSSRRCSWAGPPTA